MRRRQRADRASRRRTRASPTRCSACTTIALSLRDSAPPRARRCASASTATASRGASPTCSRQGSAGERCGNVGADAPRVRSTASIERARRDRAVADAARAGRFSHCGVTLDLGRGAGLDSAPRSPPTRSGGSRGSSSTTGWTSRTPSRAPATALPRRVGATGRVVSRRCRSGTTPPTSPPAGSRTGSTPGSASPRRRLRGPRRRRWTSALVSRAWRRAHVRATTSRRAQPPHARALRAVARRARAPGPRRRRRAARLALDELARNVAADIRADGVHRECSTHYHLIVLRSLLGARENARRFALDAPARLRRAPDAGLRLRAALPAGRTGDPGAVRRRHRATYARLLALGGRSAGAPRPALGRDRRRARQRRRALETSASPTAATTSSAAAGATATGRTRTSAS